MTMSPEPTPATTSTDATLDRKRRPGLRRLLAYGAGALAAIGLVAFIVAGPGSYERGSTDYTSYSPSTPAPGG